MSAAPSPSVQTAAGQAEDPQVARLLAEGEALLGKGGFAEAELKCLEVLGRAPKNAAALTLLYKIKRKANKPNEAIESLRKLVAANPNLLWALNELAIQLFNRGDRVECEGHARNAIRVAPRNAQGHNMLGMIMAETNRQIAAEFHYRRALDYGEPSARVLTNLANCLKNQGKMEESEALFERALALEPENVAALLGYVRMEEARRNFPKAWELLRRAEAITPEMPDLPLLRGVLHGRTKDYDAALADLSVPAKKGAGRDGGLSPVLLLERGRLLDKVDRYGEAWADWTEAKRIIREVQGRRYGAEAAEGLVRRLTGFFTRARLGLLPRASAPEDVAQPVFIVGFPRSGTTMVEQTLTAHPAIAAADELPFVNDLTRISPRMLNSPLAYPEALADLWMGDNQLALDNMRDFYLKRTEQLGVLKPGARWFTDKMPLNETHLGFISMLFPQSPIIHVRRHPLDIVISVFSNFLTHGFNCAFDLKTIAQHIVLIHRLVAHYRAELDMRYLPVRYEDLVADQETNVRVLLDFVGEPFDARCLQFHENTRYARTASYAQVTEKLYDSSVYRHRKYLEFLEPVLPMLRQVIAELGYPPV